MLAARDGSTPFSSALDWPFRFVSRRWLHKLELFSVPPPVDNRDLCCSHGVALGMPSVFAVASIPVVSASEDAPAPPTAVESSTPLLAEDSIPALADNSRAILVSQAGFERLVSSFGGGPEVAGFCLRCEKCHLPSVRENERQFIGALDARAASEGTDSDPFYVIHFPWLAKWRKFIGGGKDRPGPISNTALFRVEDDKQPIQDDPSLLKPNLQRGVDYKGMHYIVWKGLFDIYGGGPEIARRTLDIYEQPLMTVKLHTSGSMDSDQ